MFSFTSMGGKIDHAKNNGCGPYTFVLSGLNYHHIGSLLPENGAKLVYSQLYIYDTENEVENRISAVSKHLKDSTIDPIIVQQIKDMLNKYNPFGRGRLQDDIDHFADDIGSNRANKRVSMREYFVYKLMTRHDEVSTILHAGRLFQQFVVDAYTMIEAQRLLWVRTHQKELRADMYQGLSDALISGERNASTIGKRIILPSSFTGGARYMIQAYQDAMTICRFAGYPDLFITFTCNPSWPEIARFCARETLSASNRADILSRIFRLKLKALMNVIKQKGCLGTFPPVERLSFHLPDQQCVIYSNTDDVAEILAKPRVSESMFIAWMKQNKDDDLAKTLYYYEFPQYYVYHRTKRMWKIRKRGFAIGRLMHAAPSSGEFYYLRILLTKVKGPSSYEAIRIIDGVVHPTYRAACIALGLLDDDCEFLAALKEASMWASSWSPRTMFVSMLLCCCLTRPEVVWKETSQLLSEDLLHIPQRDPMSSTIQIVKSLNVDQHVIYNTVMSKINSGHGGFFFVYGYGGTGKTFLWHAFTSSIRSRGEIVLTVASSGLPLHILILKVGVPIMLLRNIDQSGLCNGTRLRVTHLGNNVIEGLTLNGSNPNRRF
ncbi:hypothetical protein K1719_034277 [Acacia pycnantha]|nr:hypothetical protein K1719_034277 [Acacia pycnantha]